MRPRILCQLVLCMGLLHAHAQQTPPLPSASRSLSCIKDYAHGAQKMASRLREKSEKTLVHMRGMEKRLAKKLLKKDTLAGKALAARIEQRYQQYSRLLTDSVAIDPHRQYYIPLLDSAGLALRIMQAIGLPGSQQQLAARFQSSLGLLQESVTRTNILQQALSDRVRELRAQLSSSLPLLKELDKITNTVAYYKATLAGYRSLLNEPDQLLAKMLTLLSKTAVFKRLFERYSMLASLLPPAPANLADPFQVGSLQVRNAVMTSISLAGNNPNIIQTLQQQVGRTPNPLQALKDKIMALKKDRNLEDPTDNVPNKQRTKTLMQRLEIGSNFQSTRSTTYFPVTTDLGLSIGFRINDRSIVGIGGAYRLGWGKDFRHINISHQGVSLRSFLNTRIKGSFSATGGYELNLQQAFDGLQAIPDLHTWRKSGLIGITKTVDLHTKVLKRTQVQVLLDLLSFNTAYPPLLVRVGYQFTN